MVAHFFRPAFGTLPMHFVDWIDLGLILICFDFERVGNKHWILFYLRHLSPWVGGIFEKLDSNKTSKGKSEDPSELIKNCVRQPKGRRSREAY